MRKFGTEGTAEFTIKMQEYRDWTISRLGAAVERFIAGIQDSLYIFPVAVKWLVRQLHLLLTESGCVNAREVCTNAVNSRNRTFRQ